MMISENGHVWVEEQPVIKDFIDKNTEKFLNKTIYCSWIPKDTTGLVAWFKNHNTHGECPKVDKCPHGWEKVGKAHAAHYMPEYQYFIPRLELAPEFGKPCIKNGAPDPTFLCQLRNRDPSCTYEWVGEKITFGFICYNSIEYATVVMEDATRVLRTTRYNDVLMELCNYNKKNNAENDNCQKNGDQYCRIFDYYDGDDCRVCPKTNPYFYND
jgi:hypothetical protein